MSGGGGGYQYVPIAQSSNSNTSTTIPGWLTDASKRGVSMASSLLSNPGQSYGGELTAGLTGDQQNAGTLIRNSVGQYQPYFDAATGMTAAATGGAGNVRAGTYANGLSNIGQYMNPFISNVVDSMTALNRQNLDNSLTQTADQAIGAKAFGGSRHGVQEGVATANNNLGLSNAVANLLSSGYNQATGLLGQDITNNMNAQQLNQASRNAQLDRILNAGNQMANIGTSNRAANTADINNLMNYGTLQQSTNQTADTNAYNEFLRQQNLPYQALQAYNQTIASAPHDTNQSTSTSSFNMQPQQMASSSPLSTGLGMGLTGLSMFGGQYSPVKGLLSMFA